MPYSPCFRRVACCNLCVWQPRMKGHSWHRSIYMWKQYLLHRGHKILGQRGKKRHGKMKLRSRSPGTWNPSENITIRVEYYECVSSEWNIAEWNIAIRVEYSECVSSEWNIAIRVKSIRVEYAIWVKSFRVEYCHPSKILPSGILPSEWNSSEWKFAILVESCQLSERLTVRVTLRSRNRSDIKSG